ncbi:spore gernimation protein GerPD [Paenibacillus sp. NPDC056579]|uniref:spore gernimation protein GerPD n=1 Tax=unclassified Paenibacillus TaxID=185978 RepID=UPI001EF8E0FD|nr:spore gernimation protein GerPD [Paenibacillus sp. H1-7]ULL15372.1 spore gernimation protein GerPD [Paenibacillus sp. H1-7]
MRMTVNNKCIQVGELVIEGVGSSSLVLVGDANVITSSSYFDTPASSFVQSLEVPLPPENETP